MPKLPRVTSGEMVKALTRAGFVSHHQTGSHLTMIHPNGTRLVVPMHGRTLGVGLTHALIKQAGLTMEEFVALLR